MHIASSFISTVFDGVDKGYIYIWYSITQELVYVGQTASQQGVLGRAVQHVQRNPDGTLRKNAEAKMGLTLEGIPDLTLSSFLLPRNREFVSTDKAYREAVEYLVQIGLLENRSKLSNPFTVISWVRSNDRTNIKMVVECANSIVAHFLHEYENCTAMISRS